MFAAKKTLLSFLGAFMLTAQSHAYYIGTYFPTNYLSEPHGVAVDPDGNVYVSDGGNGQRIVKISLYGEYVTLAGRQGVRGDNDGSAVGIKAYFNEPQGIVYTGGNLVVADSANNKVRLVTISTNNVGTVTTLIPRANPTTLDTLCFPSGLALGDDGSIYVADTGNSQVLKYSTDGMLSLVVGPPWNAQDNNGVVYNDLKVQPSAMAVISANDIWIADSYNHVILEYLNGVVYLRAGIPETIGADDSVFGEEATFNTPKGLFYDGKGSIIVSDTGNSLLRLISTNTSPDISDYSVSTIAGTVGKTGNLDATALGATLNLPMGLASKKPTDIYSAGKLFVADSASKAIRYYSQTTNTVAKISNPKIGWVKFILNSDNEYVSLFQDVSDTSDSAPFNNIPIFSIQQDETGVTTQYSVKQITDSSDDGQLQWFDVGADNFYPGDGTDQTKFTSSLLVDKEIFPKIQISAKSTCDGRLPSDEVTAILTFQVAQPSFSGDNYCSLTLLNSTTAGKVRIHYTAVDQSGNQLQEGTVESGSVIDIAYKNGQDVTISATADNYYVTSSGIISTNTWFNTSKSSVGTFYSENAGHSKVSFGFGESYMGSTEYLAIAGRSFVTPVSSRLIPSSQPVYSLQFGILAEPDAQTAALQTPRFYFESSLRKIVTPYSIIPCGMYNYNVTSSNYLYTNLLTTNYANNLLTVGWLERYGHTNLYDTKQQTLLTNNSWFRDIQFTNGDVLLGGYSIWVPENATPGMDRYTLRLTNASGTSDGYQAPVKFDLITDDSIDNLAMKSVKRIEVVDGSEYKYLVGDICPYLWVNTGDFGDGGLDNADVMQVFAAACYSENVPPKNSLMFDAMDSAGRKMDRSLVSQDYSSPYPDIDGVGYGDGVIDVNDVYVTFRRSIDPSLKQIYRYWQNGTNYAVYTSGAAPAIKPRLVASTGPHSLTVEGTNVVTSSTTTYVPINVEVVGDAPLRVFMMNAVVTPLDGSPAPVSVDFTEVENVASGNVLGGTLSSDSFAAAWLNSDVVGISGTNLLGVFSIQFPETVNSQSAYLLHFNHFSGSPNGVALLPVTTNDTLITFSDRKVSSWNDGIPDSWRLKYFGTVSNVLSAASADADGDGYSNLAEYQAGTNPLDASSKPGVDLKLTNSHLGNQTGFSFSWPTVTGQNYTVEYATSLVSTNWTVISSNLIGDGSLKSFNDGNATNETRFYRVRIQ